MPLISIITACYNQGNFLKEAFASIELDKNKEIFEHIVINDGSTDEETIRILKEMEGRGVKVIHQQNKGLGAARNAGIRISTGKYILPLDCDNKIDPKVMIEGAQKMERNEKINVVYTDARYFGARKASLTKPRWSATCSIVCVEKTVSKLLVSTGILLASQIMSTLFLSDCIISQPIYSVILPEKHSFVRFITTTNIKHSS